MGWVLLAHVLGLLHCLSKRCALKQHLVLRARQKIVMQTIREETARHPSPPLSTPPLPLVASRPHPHLSPPRIHPQPQPQPQPHPHPHPEQESCETLLKSILPAHLLESLGGVLPQLNAISSGGGGNLGDNLLTNSEVIAEKFHGCSFLFAKVVALLPCSRRLPSSPSSLSLRPQPPPFVLHPHPHLHAYPPPSPQPSPSPSPSPSPLPSPSPSPRPSS